MATTQLSEETVKKVIRQVEFYFSDSNIPRDNFLRNTISESEDGMVSLALICSFARMRGHLGLGEIKAEDVSEDTVKAVAEALKSSATLKISDDGKKVGRITELPKTEEVIEQLDVRTIAASPIEYDTKLEDVESFFAKFAKVNSVRLPRHVADKRLFCGTALIEFSSEEDAAKILSQSLVFGGAELELRPKKDFDEQRAKEEAENTRRQMGSNHKKSSPETDYPKGLIIAFKLKSMPSKDSSAESGSEVKTSDAVDGQEADAKPDSMELVTEDADNKGSENVEKSGKEGTEEENEKVDVKSSLEDKEADAKPDSMELVTEDADNKGSENVEKSGKEGTEEENEKVDVKSCLEDKEADAKPDSMELVTEDADNKGSENVEKSGEEGTEEENEKVDVKSSLEDKEAEDEKKSVDILPQKDEEKSKDEQKLSANMYKDNKDVVLREDLKSVFQKFGTVKYIDFKMGEDSGYIRFEEEEGGQKARAAAVLAEEGGLIVKNYVAILDSVTGEAEKEYWNMLRGQEKFRGNKGNRGRGGRNNRGGRQHIGKRNHSRDDKSGNRPNKFQKV